MIEAKEKTALAASVGADDGQSVQILSEKSIATTQPESNSKIYDPEKEMENMMREMRRINDPAYLPTVTMQELYENVYQSRPPVIDGLLYSGTYLFAGAPKVGKSFFVAQLAYHG